LNRLLVDIVDLKSIFFSNLEINLNRFLVFLFQFAQAVAGGGRKIMSTPHGKYLPSTSMLISIMKMKRGLIGNQRSSEEAQCSVSQGQNTQSLMKILTN